MWPKDYINMCHIFYYNFYVHFLQSTWIRPQKIFQTRILVVTSLVNHQPVNIIIWIDIAMSDRAKWYLTIAFHKYTFTTFLLQVYCIMPLWESSYHWLSGIAMSIQMIMFTGWWMTSDVTTSILVWKIFFCGRIQVLWRKFTEKWL